MTKLCPRGKAAAKRKFKVYPSAYANAYASKICAGKIKDPSGVKRKDFRGPKPSKASGGRVGLKDGSGKTPMTPKQKKFAALAPPRNKITYADKIAGATGRTKAMGGRIGYESGTGPDGVKRKYPDGSDIPIPLLKKPIPKEKLKKDLREKLAGEERPKKAGGGLMAATERLRRQGLRGGGLCKKGMNRKAIGKNS